MSKESEIKKLKERGKSIFQIAYELNLDVETVIKVVHGTDKLSKTTKFRQYAPVKIKCLCCGKEFISKDKKTNRICNKCKSEQERGCLNQYLGY